MIAKEVKRRTDKVNREMSEVIVNEGPVSAVAKGVQDVNVTLAHHAAWTEERFEGVEGRLGSLELGQQHIRKDIAGLDMRLGNLEIAFVGMRADMVRMEERLTSRIDTLAVGVNTLTGRVDTLAGRVESLTGRVDTLTGRVDGLAVHIDGLAVRIDKVLAFAIKDDLKLAEILNEGEDDRQ